MTVKTQDTSHASLPREVRILVAARVVDRLGGFTLTFLPLLLVTAYGASLRAAGLVAAGLRTRHHPEPAARRPARGSAGASRPRSWSD